MKNRLLKIRLTLLSGLSLLSLFLFSFSCEDHVVPNNPVPAAIKTLDGTVFPLLGPNLFAYRYQFENLGNIPVIEHGIVRIVGEVGSPPQTPTISDHKRKSETMANLEVKSLSEAFDPLLTKQVSYRAYAILENGSIVYGEVKTRLTTPDIQNEPTIKTLDANVSASNIKYGVQITTDGSIPILEFGIVYITGIDPTPVTPGESNSKIVFTALMNTDPIFQQADIGDFGLVTFYRAYAKLLNGKTIFGEVKMTGKDTQ